MTYLTSKLPMTTKLVKTKYFWPIVLLVFLLVAIPLTVKLILEKPNPASKAATPNFLPNGWPGTFHLGYFDAPGGAASMKASSGFGFRYLYLAGGVNTGNGWANWNSNGSFANNFVTESAQNGIIPVFTYYMMYQSSPGNTQSEIDGISTNLNNTQTMTAYYNDFKLLLQRSAVVNSKVIVHVEPDAWGYIQRRATGDNAASVPAKVGSTGLPELAGLPDNGSGFAQALVKLRNLYAPNVNLGFHISIWGTGNDIQYSNPDNTTLDGLSTRSANFYKSLNANYDLIFFEVRDRDAAFYQYQYGNPGAYWDSGDYDRHIRYVSNVSQAIQKNVLLWQIPYGNTKMKALNNSWNHYQDNFVETTLGALSRDRLNSYLNAGVVGMLFGRGADGATCNCDANNDGITNPTPINGNNIDSLSADDDGGYFLQQAKKYYQAPISLGTSTTLTPTPTVTLTLTPTPTPTSNPTPTPTPLAGFTTSATISPVTVGLGGETNIAAKVTSNTARTVLVDIEVYDSGNQKVFQHALDSQIFTAGESKSYPVIWEVPNNEVAGTHTVKIGIFSPGWGTLYHWNANAGSFSVTNVLVTPTPTPTPTSIPTPTATKTPTPSPTANPTPTPSTGTGLTGQYFNNTDFTDLKITRVDPTINYNWRLKAPVGSLHPDTFSVRWTGQILAPTTGNYTFYTISDDGVRLWINNQLVIDHWGDHPQTEDAGVIPLQAGRKYTIKMEYFENYSYAVAKLKWSTSTQKKQVIPQRYLFPQ